MPVRETDARTAEADRAYAKHVQRGAPPAVVAALLPSLVGPPRSQQAAEAWLVRNAYGAGHNLSPEGVARDQVLLGQAKALHESLLRSGVFAGLGLPVFVVEPKRYGLSEKDASEALREYGPEFHHWSAAHNARVLSAAELEPELIKKHGAPVSISDNGKVYQWRNGERVHVDTVQLDGQPDLNDVSHLQRRQREDTNLSNADSGDEWSHGSDRPYFADRA